MADLFKLQRQATRDPDDGKALMLEVLKLDYDYDDTGASLQLAVPATSSNPILLWDVGHIVRTGFANAGANTIDIGDGTDADEYIANASIAEVTAGDLVWARDGAADDHMGEYLTAARQITVSLSAGMTAGAGTVLAFVFRL